MVRQPDNSLFVASGFVIVGLAIEMWPDVRKLHWWHWDNALFLEIFGGAIVTIAIAGELFLTFMGSQAETSLRTANTQYASFLEKEAADALESAANANTRAAAIMKATAWRQFTQNQLDTMYNVLNRKPQKVLLAWVANDAESFSLAEQFSEVLTRAKWEFTTSAKTFSSSLIWDIRVPDTPNGDEATQQLRAALTAVGIHVSKDEFPPQAMAYGGGPQEGAARILFGSKKPTFAQPPN